MGEYLGAEAALRNVPTPVPSAIMHAPVRVAMSTVLDTPRTPARARAYQCTESCQHLAANWTACSARMSKVGGGVVAAQIREPTMKAGCASVRQQVVPAARCSTMQTTPGDQHLAAPVEKGMHRQRSTDKSAVLFSPIKAAFCHLIGSEICRGVYECCLCWWDGKTCDIARRRKDGSGIVLVVGSRA